ncbi:MAG: hypothetical protein DSZ02_01545 [Gammaproteobacteria bacterium]|nr:MAG: hypothetical protein DSZ02_01545 [Gammaproteobacteria bacterium]
MVVLLLITVLSRRLSAHIRSTAPGGAKPGHGSFLDTIRALLLSQLLPLWIVFWLGFLYWLLREDGGISDYGDAIVSALKWNLPIFYSILAARALTIRGGLLQAHFRWTAETVRKLRRALDYLLWLFIPASVLTSIAIHVLPEGLGSVTVKLAFVVLAGTMSLFIYQVLHPIRGLIASYLKANPNGYLSRLRWLWFFAVVAIPLLLLGLSLAGYVYSAATILRHLVSVLWLIAILVLVQQLAEFWLLLTRRRLAYKAALERRRALAKQQAETEPGPAEGEREQEREAVEEASRVDLAALSKESRKLLNALLFIGGAVGVWLIWSPLIPALGVLDEIALWQQSVTVEGHQERVAVTVGDVLSVLSIVVITVLAAKNLPSLIEILLLQYFRISPGSRYTIRTLAGYIIAAVGMVALFKAVGGSWSSIQWLVAALGVGIGFGLQEIVANFISGLIILFERPIRVGDYVTVGDTDGTVTRIRIRATTILTRDRKELLVPNKEFITGRLLNWTLSDPTTRLKVVVGIRYGADVRLAEKIMLEAAREHPRVLREPAPWVNFNDFGDSALLLELRCIVDSAEYRVKVASELRHVIDSGFRAAEMEIPFPQRDVHLDTLQPLEVRIQSQE